MVRLCPVLLIFPSNQYLLLMIDIKGKRFGHLVAVEPTKLRRGSSVVWRCMCDCGGEKLTTVGYLRHGWVKSCGCQRARHHQFGKPKSPEYRLLCSAKERAKAGLEFNLTVNDICIPECCPLLGIPLFKNPGTVGPNSPSIDRIDSTKGYTRDNVWVISHKANSMKAGYSLIELQALVRNLETQIALGRSNSRQLIYLASPYTHPDKIQEQKRYEMVLDAWKWLIDHHSDLNFFSPVIQSHQLVVHTGLPGDWHYWADFDATMIRCCAELWVLCAPGFKESVGVTAELKIANDLCRPIRFLVPNGHEYNLTVERPA